MNERIKDMAFRAGFVGESMYPIIGTTQEQALNNFVELIVQDCVEVCEVYRSTEWGKVAECIGDKIKEHFGVKE